MGGRLRYAEAGRQLTPGTADDQHVDNGGEQRLIRRVLRSAVLRPRLRRWDQRLGDLPRPVRNNPTRAAKPRSKALRGAGDAFAGSSGRSVPAPACRLAVPPAARSCPLSVLAVLPFPLRPCAVPRPATRRTGPLGRRPDGSPLQGHRPPPAGRPSWARAFRRTPRAARVAAPSGSSRLSRPPVPVVRPSWPRPRPWLAASGLWPPVDGPAVSPTELRRSMAVRRPSCAASWRPVRPARSAPDRCPSVPHTAPPARRLSAVLEAGPPAVPRPCGCARAISPAVPAPRRLLSAPAAVSSASPRRSPVAWRARVRPAVPVHSRPSGRCVSRPLVHWRPHCAGC